MGSRSSQRKNDSSERLRLIRELLCDGLRLEEPNQARLEAAQFLEKRGIVCLERSTFLRCADPAHPHVTWKSRDCRGVVEISPDLDIEGGELQCSECDRRIYSRQNDPLYRQAIQIQIQWEGVVSYVRSILQEAELHFREMTTGVFRVDVEEKEFYLCLAELCKETKYNSREWAAAHPTIYLGIESRGHSERFRDEDWFHRIEFSDLLAGQVDLVNYLQRQAANKLPASIPLVSMPIYVSGVSPHLRAIPSPIASTRMFVVEVGDKVIRIDDVEVLGPKAVVSFELFRILWDLFVDDLKMRKRTPEFHYRSLGKIIEDLYSISPNHTTDEYTVRRYINRLQTDFAEKLRRERGTAIGREDIIQTSSVIRTTQGNDGYRINPLTVIARPFQVDPPRLS